MASFNGEELVAIREAVKVFEDKLEIKLAQLNECSTHFYVNEGLLNEVRIEKEKIAKKMNLLRQIMDKLPRNEDV